MSDVLRTVDLCKNYNGIPVVSNVNLHIESGDIYGFLGKNGAGKTTTIKMILGLIQPSFGTVELFGKSLTRDSYEEFRQIGSIIEYPGSYENLTAYENLDIHRRLMRIKKKDCIEKALDTVQLNDARNKKVREFSLGMKQRLGIARALLHDPKFLILDEPTNGLDPVGIKEIRELIVNLARKHTITVFVSSHILSELEQMVTKIGIIHDGVLLEENNLSSLKNNRTHYIQMKVDDGVLAYHLLKDKYDLIQEGNRIKIFESFAEARSINRLLVMQGVSVDEINLLEDNLEDYFLSKISGE